ncbi:hypothetical protein M514_03708, partial [Trichuris suis]
GSCTLNWIFSTITSGIVLPVTLKHSSSSRFINRNLHLGRIQLICLSRLKTATMNIAPPLTALRKTDLYVKE